MFAYFFAALPSPTTTARISGRSPPPTGRRVADGLPTVSRRGPEFCEGRAVRVLIDRRRRRRRGSVSTAASLMVSPAELGWLWHDVFAAVVTSAAAMSLLKFWEELARRQIFEQKLSRKLVHISVGLVFMLFWPLFSSGSQAPFLAALAPGINIFRMILLGSGIMKNDAIVKSMSRTGDYRELLKGPFYYACTLTLATAYFWRSSPIAIAAVCNLCAGDGIADVIGRRFGHQKLPYNRDKSFMGTIAMALAGIADVIGRRFGHQKLPYNRDKSFMGTIAMALAGFIASVGYMHYFSSFGYIQESWQLCLGFLLVSIVSAIVESLPISTKLDDNLTVTVASVLAGSLILQ